MAWRPDEKWLAEYQERMRKMGNGGNVPKQPVLPQMPEVQEPKRTKYGNQKTESSGKRFDSKHEAKCYEELRLRCLAGEFISLACQVPFYLPGGIKYVADFVCLKPDLTSVVFDAKSEATRKDKVYVLKRKLMLACHKITVQEI